MDIKEYLVEVKVVGAGGQDTNGFPIALHDQLGKLAATTTAYTLMQ